MDKIKEEDKVVEQKKLEMSAEELKGLLVEITGNAIDEKLKSLGFDGSAGKFVAPTTTDEKKVGKERIGKFISAVFRKDFGVLGTEFKAALNESTGSQGGFNVPTEFASEVNRIVEDFGIVAKLARRYPMKSDSLNIPRLASSVTISYPGELGAGTPSLPVFQQVQLVAKTAIGITPMSNELLADANVDMVDLLVQLFAEAIAGDIDVQGLVGSGAPFTGILNDAGVTVVTPAAGNSTFQLAATPDNARTLISNIKPWALQGAAFVMHRTVWGILQTQKTSGSGEYFLNTNNGQILSNNQVGFPSAAAGYLWGYPVYLSDKMPSATAVSTKFILFGNLKNMYWGTRQDMQVSISQEATVGTDNLFQQNMSAVRVTYRHAIAVGLPAAFAVLKTSAT